MSEPEQQWMFLASSDDILKWKLLCWSMVILPKRIICDSECQCPHRHGDWQPHTLLKHCVYLHCTVSRVLKYNSSKVDNPANDCKRKNAGLQL